MEVAGWVVQRLTHASDWSAELARLRHATDSAQRTFDVAVACEHCDPDRGRALALYLAAWRGGVADAAAHATRLARCLRAHVTIAELALAAREDLTAAAAFIDAGMRDSAVAPLRRYLDGAAPRRAEASALLALAEGLPIDVDAAINASLASAKPADFVHAARLARSAAQPRLASIVASAARACVDDPDVMVLVEDHLLESSDSTALLEHYRRWFERAPTQTESVERMRAAGCELIARGRQPGLGLRMVRLALETAYSSLLPGVTSQIAAWEVLLAHARSQHSTSELVPLLVQALAAPVAPYEAVYLACVGLTIAWRDAGDTLAAQPYAATLLDFVDDHPLAQAFIRAAGLKVTAAPESSSPTPPPAAVAARPNVYADDKGVRRTAKMEKLSHATNRLALLKPPPPRATSLKRDTNPIPMRPRPPSASPAPRAPRVVVPIDVVVELPSGGFFTTVLRDLSTSGAFVVTKRVLEVGAVLTLDLQLPTAGLQLQAFQAQARIARRSELGYGIAFIDPDAALVAAIRTATGE